MITKSSKFKLKGTTCIIKSSKWVLSIPVFLAFFFKFYVLYIKGSYYKLNRVQHFVTPLLELLNLVDCPLIKQ